MKAKGTISRSLVWEESRRYVSLLFLIWLLLFSKLT